MTPEWRQNDTGMIQEWKWPKLPFSGMVAKGRQWSPRVSKDQGGPQGWVRWVITRSIIFKSFSYTIFKIGRFPHWNPHQKRKWLVICHFLVYNSENWIVGSLYPLASCVKGGSDSETKSLFWSRLMCNVHCTYENCFVGSLYPLTNCVKGGSDSETKSLF